LDEFRSIAELFAPLARAEAEGLRDDAAFLPARPGQELVITADAVVEGVHFLPGTPPELVARKLLRVNLSDLAAKAAEPFGYLLTVAWPESWGEGARAAFAGGLAADQARFGLGLLGGDTVSTPGPMTAGITALGYAPRAVRRRGARPGDVLLVSGTLGDGWLGLEAARGRGGFSMSDRDALAERYHLPEPRLALAAILRSYARAALDVSDGLLADVGHLAFASEVGCLIQLERLPLSAPAAAWLARQSDRAAALEALASGGDDYEIALAVGPEVVGAVQAAGAAAGVPVTVVGEVRAGTGTTVTFEGRLRAPLRTGWRHD
jgi:thiamine-monophosphate kinase